MSPPPSADVFGYVGKKDESCPESAGVTNGKDSPTSLSGRYRTN